MYLHRKENYSQYINDLVDKDRLASGDEKLINTRILEHQKEINRLNELKQTKQGNSVQLQQILEQSLQKFEERNQDVQIMDSQNRDWIKRTIIPDLRKTNCRLDEYKLLEMFKAGRVDVSG
jgi:hypothetical protein